MPGYLESTVAQKIRDFLDNLEAAPPPTASAQEALNLLVSRVRGRREDAELRKRLRSLLDDLAEADAERLPAPQCETLNAEALADEIAGLLTDPAAISTAAPSRAAATFLAAALLTAGLAMATGCNKHAPPSAADERSRAIEKCKTDTTSEHFLALIQAPRPGVSSSPENRVVEKFIAETDAEKAETLRSLCGMEATDIRAYVQETFREDIQRPSERDARLAEAVRKEVWEEKAKLFGQCRDNGSADHFRRLLQQRTPLDNGTINRLVKEFDGWSGRRIGIITRLCGAGGAGLARAIEGEFHGLLTREQIKSLYEPHEDKPGDYVADVGIAYKGVEF